MRLRFGVPAFPAFPMACVLAAALLLSQRAGVHAQAAGVGSGLDALPGVHEVPLALPSPATVMGRVGLGYGWTESVLNMNDSHHRMQLDAAASVAALPWLSPTLRVLGRYDLHEGVPNAPDYGVITETHLGARATHPLGTALHAGAALELWLPAGDNVVDALSALSGELQLLVTYAPKQSPLTVGLALGLRLNRSRYAGGQPQLFSAADRLALGASDELWALRQGLGLSYRVGPLEWVAEWAFRMYFARIAQSPMWVRAGARYRVSSRVQLELLLGVSPSKRPSLAQAAPLFVVEPRLWAGLAVTYAWAVAPSPPVGRQVSAPAPVTQPRPRPKPPAQVHGQVLGPSGAVLAGAAVTLSGSATRVDTTTDDRGTFAFTGLPAGRYELVVTAQGLRQAQQAIVLRPADARQLTISLEPELPSGQIRGTVRRFNGQPVAAHVAIAQLGFAADTREDGTFEIDVPPGDYSVVVSADGFRSQTRRARVQLRGVAILIIELEPSR